MAGPWFATAPILMFDQHRSQTLILCLCASGALTWLAACGASSDGPPSPGRSTAGSGGAAAATAGAPPAGASNSTAGATVSGGGGGTSSAGATSAAGAPTNGGAVGAAGAAGAATSTAGAAGAATGTAGAAGGAGTPLESPPGFFSAGYLSRAPWMGYVFTIVDSVGSTVSPLCDTTGCMPAWGTQACAKGTVLKNASSSGFAGLAFHANDPMVGTRGTWTSTGAGIYVSISNPPALARLQLQEEVASDDTRYCAKMPTGGTGLIPFSEFKTFCWGDTAHPSKAFVIGTAVSEVTVNIPGNQSADVPFDFCLIDIQPR